MHFESFQSDPAERDRQWLSGMTDKLVLALEAQGKNLADIELIAYCAGPGGFSAIRCAVIFVRFMRLLQPRLRLFEQNHLLLFRDFLGLRDEIVLLKQGSSYYLSENDTELAVCPKPEDEQRVYDIADYPDFESTKLMLENFGREILANEEILPHYLREPKLGIAKKKEIKH